MGIKKVLILSKSKFFSEALRFILHDLSVETEVADSWDKFNNLSSPYTYDVIVCDLSCIDRNIEKNIKDIKNKYPSSKVVIFSFNPEDKCAGFLKNSYVDCIVTRPLQCDVVINKLKTILQSSS